jgi:hypothetical protein
LLFGLMTGMELEIHTPKLTCMVEDGMAEVTVCRTDVRFLWNSEVVDSIIVGEMKEEVSVWSETGSFSQWPIRCGDQYVPLGKHSWWELAPAGSC